MLELYQNYCSDTTAAQTRGKRFSFVALRRRYQVEFACERLPMRIDRTLGEGWFERAGFDLERRRLFKLFFDFAHFRRADDRRFVAFRKIGGQLNIE